MIEFFVLSISQVTMIKSRPSVAYKRHSPRQWSQELVLDDVRREEGGQRQRLRELRREYKQIEAKYKSKIIEDLAGLYYESKEERSDKKLIKSRRLRRTEEVRVDVHEDIIVHQETSNQIGKGDRQLAIRKSEERSEDSSLGQSITITVTRSSIKNAGQANDNPSKREIKGARKVTPLSNTGASSDDDTLNGTLEIDEEEEVNVRDADIEKVKEENRLLRRKLKKQRNMRQEVERLTEEANDFRENINALKNEIAIKAEENVRLKQSKGPFVRQDSINEIPERDVPLRDRLVQTSQVQKSSSVELDPFTEVIIDDLKKEIRSLKEDVEVRDLKLKEKNLKMESMARDNVDLSKNLSAVINKSKEGVKSFEESFQAKEDKMLAKIKSLKDEMFELKLKTGEENSGGTEVEMLKAEIEKLKKLLEQGNETNITLESYVNFLKQSYNATFGPIN